MAGELMLINPRKRRTTRKKRRSPVRRARRRTYAKRRRNPVAAANPRRRRSYRRRRNPAKMNFGRMIQQNIMPAATAAGGAIGIDVLMGLLPLPANLKTGPMRHLVKGAVALGAGMLAQNFVKPKTAELFTSGALTVVMYDAGKEMITRFMPDMAAKMGLSGMGLYYDEAEMMGLGYAGAGYTGIDYMDESMEGMGLYYDEELEGLGQGEMELEEFDL